MAYSTFWREQLARFKTATPKSETCFWRVDIHSQLVPGIDAGVKDAQDALTCLTQLANWGIQKIITPPYISGDRYPTSIEEIRQGQQTLRVLTDKHRLSVSIEIATESLFDGFFFHLLQKKSLLSFGAKRYMLIETGFDDVLFRIQTQGYTPVLAHPERYRSTTSSKINCFSSAKWDDCFSSTGCRSADGMVQSVRSRLVF
jgi:protein-tyrosine phosphatase